MFRLSPLYFCIMGLWRFLPLLVALPDVVRSFDSTCTLQPLGDGLDDTDQAGSYSTPFGVFLRIYVD